MDLCSVIVLILSATPVLAKWWPKKGLYRVCKGEEGLLQHSIWAGTEDQREGKAADETQHRPFPATNPETDPLSPDDPVDGDSGTQPATTGRAHLG